MEWTPPLAEDAVRSDSHEDILRKLRSEVGFIRTAWDYYDAIYRKDASVATWQESGVSGFFQVLQRLLSSEIVLRLARLFDPETTKVRGVIVWNIVLKRACGESAELLQEFLELEKIVAEPGGIWECRNKLISHLDEASFRDRRSYLHPELPVLLDRIEEFMRQADPDFPPPIQGSISTPADDLMLILRQYNRSRFP